MHGHKCLTSSWTGQLSIIGIASLLTTVISAGAFAAEPDAAVSLNKSNSRGTLAAKANEALYPTRIFPVMSANKDCQIPPIGAVSPFPIGIRIGALLSPRIAFDGGVDVSIPGIHLLPGFTTRLDADVFLNANFGGVSTLIPVTFDQVYTKGLALGSKIYLGGGIGAYLGKTTRLGGKILAGAALTPRLGVEGAVHFPGSGDVLLTAQARVSL